MSNINLAKLSVNGINYNYYSIENAAEELGLDLGQVPITVKVMLENALRSCSSSELGYKHDRLQAFKEFLSSGDRHDLECDFYPSRVLMQDMSGVPALVDIASIREFAHKSGKRDLSSITPKLPVDLVIDHSVQVHFHGDSSALRKNIAMETRQNLERYKFLKWAGRSLSKLRVVPPGSGICHQMNMEFLAHVVCNENGVLFPDTVVGTDSHTTMINSMGVLGWGVGGIEAESVLLGQPISMVMPKVVGFELKGALSPGITATDLVLTVTNMLRKRGVVGKFVEFYGDGLNCLDLTDRATISNMSPECGSTCCFFPVDDSVIKYLELTGRNKLHIELVEMYSKAQGMWRGNGNSDSIPKFDENICLDLSSVCQVVAGPSRPQDKILLPDVAKNFCKNLQNAQEKTSLDEFSNGSIVIAAITSCTNTSNPKVIIAAGLLAKKAVNLGLKPKPWVKTSLAPGSQVVGEYLKDSGLQTYLDTLGYNVVGYGCTTCIGNSGPLSEDITKKIESEDLNVASVLSGNRNFEARIHPLVKSNYLMSPPLVIAYSLAGSVCCDITQEKLGVDQNGRAVYLSDIWPSDEEISKVMSSCLKQNLFLEKREEMLGGSLEWKEIESKYSQTYQWDSESTYIRNPPYFDDFDVQAAISSAKNPTFDGALDSRILMLLGDSVTTDHISPAGRILPNSPAGLYLKDHGVGQLDFNSYGSRRGNHDIMVRATFANVMIKNRMVDKTGCYARHVDTDVVSSVYSIAETYKAEGKNTIIVAGKEYGTGSSRDWAAKGVKLLGVKAVIAESFERIHRSNLVQMGVMPLLFTGHDNSTSLGLTGNEIIHIHPKLGKLEPKSEVACTINYRNGTDKSIMLECAVHTETEAIYFSSGGILNYVMIDLIVA